VNSYIVQVKDSKSS